jgi:hypothetical protein
MVTTQRVAQLRGVVFAAQACSCSCDPCACGDRCTCQGADAYLGPRWRFVGDTIQTGTIEGVDVSGRTLLHLAQTAHEQSEDWHEVILIDQDATPEQADVLQHFFQERQGSEVSHLHRHPASPRPVYLVPMRYTVIEGRATLAVTFSQDRSNILGSASSPFFKEWTYDDHVAIQPQASLP